MENPLIRAEMIEANEFYDLSIRYNVSGVPQTTINDGEGVVLGAVPEAYLLQEIKRSMDSKSMIDTVDSSIFGIVVSIKPIILSSCSAIKTTPHSPSLWASQLISSCRLGREDLKITVLHPSAQNAARY